MVPCTTKVKINFFSEVKNSTFNKEEFIKNLNILKISNLYVITCYKLFFSLKGQVKNYGSYLYYT